LLDEIEKVIFIQDDEFNLILNNLDFFLFFQNFELRFNWTSKFFYRYRKNCSWFYFILFHTYWLDEITKKSDNMKNKLNVFIEQQYSYDFKNMIDIFK